MAVNTILSVGVVTTTMMIITSRLVSSEYHSLQRCDNFECVTSRLNAITYKVQDLMSLRKTVQRVERRVERQQREVQDLKMRMDEAEEELRRLRSTPAAARLASMVEDERGDRLWLGGSGFSQANGEHRLAFETRLNSSLDRISLLEKDLKSIFGHVDGYGKKVDFVEKQNAQIFATVRILSDAANSSEARISILERRENIPIPEEDVKPSGIERNRSAEMRDVFEGLAEVTRGLSEVRAEMTQLEHRFNRIREKLDLCETQFADVKDDFARCDPCCRNASEIHQRMEFLGEEVRQFVQEQKPWEEYASKLVKDLEEKVEKMNSNVRRNVTELGKDFDRMLADSEKMKTTREEIRALREKMEDVSEELRNLKEDYEKSQLIRKQEQQLRGNLMQKINSQGKSVNFEELSINLMNENTKAKSVISAKDDEEESSLISMLHSPP